MNAKQIRAEAHFFDKTDFSRMSPGELDATIDRALVVVLAEIAAQLAELKEVIAGPEFTPIEDVKGDGK